MSDETKKPAWIVITTSFGLLILIVLGYFFIQAHLVQKSFKAHIKENTLLITEVVKLNTETAVLSRKVIEDIIELFLINTATFIDYLDSVEPFTNTELNAYTLESGLSGISILNKDGNDISSGPNGWQSNTSGQDYKNTDLYLADANKIYNLSFPRRHKPGYIIVAHPASAIETLQEEIGIPRLLKILNDLPGFAYIKPDTTGQAVQNGVIRTVERKGARLVETTIFAGGTMLVVGLTADEYFRRIRQLWQEVALFSVFMALLGAFFSALVYYYQKKHIEKMQIYERDMAKSKEDAAIGRASATITHEIRNPVNAISMGLQRLQIEAVSLEPEHRQLIDAMQKAVKRTNGIITELNRYALPVKPEFKPMSPDAVVTSILSLYREKCISDKIQLDYSPEFIGALNADSALIETVMENLILNAIEAQPQGGFITIRLYCQNNDAIITVCNSGFRYGELSKIPEPYFTTKTTGSGLGLSIAEKIIHSHDGTLAFEEKKPDIITIKISLPLRQNHIKQSGEADSDENSDR